MRGSFFDRPFEQQPPDASSINWGNPLTQGLVHYAPGVPVKPDRNYDLLAAVEGVFSGAAANSVGPIGRAITLDGTANTWLDFTSSDLLKVPSFTWTGTFQINSLANAYTALFSYVGTGAATYYQMLVKSNGTLAAYAVQTGGTNVSYDGTGAFTLVAGGIYRISLAVDAVAGTVKGYVNSQLDGSASGSMGSGYPAGSGISVYIGQDSNVSGRRLTGLVNNVSYHKRALSAGEIASLHADQWQMLGPRRIWVPVSAAAGGGGGTFFNPISGRGGAAAQPVIHH